MDLIDEMYQANRNQPTPRRDADLVDTFQRMRRRLCQLEEAQEKLRVVFYEQQNLGRPLQEAIKEILGA